MKAKTFFYADGQRLHAMGGTRRAAYIAIRNMPQWGAAEFMRAFNNAEDAQYFRTYAKALGTLGEEVSWMLS